MGWKQFARAVDAAHRSNQRAAARRYREIERAHFQQAKHEAKQMAAYAKDAAKQQAMDRARYEVERYENYIELLTSVHVDCGFQWDWRAVAHSAAPPLPVKNTLAEQHARDALARHQPGFFAWATGDKERARLEQALAIAISEDDARFQQVRVAHAAAQAQWQEQVRLAPGVLALDINACRRALDVLQTYSEIQSFQSHVSLAALRDRVATVVCTMNDPELVPREELKLTSTGKVSSKEMAASKYWLLLQDHVCSCAISIARETFAVLPVERVIVNMALRQLNSATGHVEPICVLAVHFTPSGLSKLRFDSLDPSDSMKNFNHRMKFKKGAGFEAIEAANHDENWVST